jgi:hypothetical protein
MKFELIQDGPEKTFAIGLSSVSATHLDILAVRATARRHHPPIAWPTAE